MLKSMLYVIKGVYHVNMKQQMIRQFNSDAQSQDKQSTNRLSDWGVGRIKTNRIQSSEEEQLFHLVMRIGEVLLQNGAEIFRVQETMLIVANHYQVSEVDTYVISNGIFLTMNINNRGLTAKIKHIPIAPVHLERVSAANALSRDILEKQIPVKEALLELERIVQIPYAPNWARTIFTGTGSACFCYLLGGSVADSMAAGVAGLLLFLIMILLERRKTPKVLFHLFGSAFVTMISVLLFTLGLGDDLNHIIIGAIICLVPGVSMTTSIRDYFNGDHLSGTIHLVDAIQVAVSIAVGAGVVLEAWGAIAGRIGLM